MARVERRPVEITAYQFRSRFSEAERTAIRALAQTDELAADLWEAALAAQTVNLDPSTPDGGNTYQGLGYYVYRGLLTPARRDAILGAG